MIGIIQKIKENLTPDLLKKEYRNQKHPLAGHCYIASEALYHLMGCKAFKPMVLKHEGSTHWFLKHRITGLVIDITKEQFNTSVPYEKAKGCGFLTKEPSKRTKILINRIVP